VHGQLARDERRIIVVNCQSQRIPVQSQRAADAQAGIRAVDQLGDIDHHGLGLSGRESDRRPGGTPAALAVGHFDHRRDEIDTGGTRAGHVGAGVAPEEPAGHQEAQALGALHLLAIEAQLDEPRLAQTGELQRLQHEGHRMVIVDLRQLARPVPAIAAERALG
jgi:hypothetical protein